METRKIKTHKQIMDELKNTDIESYNEIKENTETVKKTFTRGGYRPNAGRKRIKNVSLNFTIRVDEVEKGFITFARENNIDLSKLIRNF